MTGQIVLKEASSSTDYTKGLRFPNDPFGGTQDIAGIRLYSSSGENQVFEFYIGNDGGLGLDNINFATGVGGTANNDSVTINGNKIWNAGNLTPQTQLNGSGFVKASGTTITYDNTSYLPLTGGTLTGSLTINVATNNFAELVYRENGDLKWNAYNDFNTDNYVLGNSGGSRFILTQAGNLGLSTPSPLNATGYTSISLNNATNGGILDYQQNGTSVMRVGNNGTTVAFIETRTSTPIQFSTNDSPAMRIASGGNVGIGTTAPGAIFHTLSTAANGGIIATTNSTTLFTEYRVNTSTAVGFIGNGNGILTGGGNTNFGVRSENDLLFGAGGNSERMRITSGGNVGIGATSFSGKLSVHDSVYGEYLRVASGVIGGNQTSLFVAWNNGGNIDIKQVTVGAADSGGTGFRVIRIPNT
jgi:hypothetical protein